MQTSYIREGSATKHMVTYTSPYMIYAPPCIVFVAYGNVLYLTSSIFFVMRNVWRLRVLVYLTY